MATRFPKTTKFRKRKVLSGDNIKTKRLCTKNFQNHKIETKVDFYKKGCLKDGWSFNMEQFPSSFVGYMLGLVDECPKAQETSLFETKDRRNANKQWKNVTFTYLLWFVPRKVLGVWKKNNFSSKTSY